MTDFQKLVTIWLLAFFKPTWGTLSKNCHFQNTLPAWLSNGCITGRSHENLESLLIKEREMDWHSFIHPDLYNLVASFLLALKGLTETDNPEVVSIVLSDPMDCSPPAPPSMGFSRQEYWSGMPLPSAHWPSLGQNVYPVAKGVWST